MPNQELPTAAEMRFLEFCRDNGASVMYSSLSTMLTLSIQNFIPDHIGAESPGSPGPVTLEAWFFTVEMLEALHRLEVGERTI